MVCLSMPAGKPLITANQVTFIRLALLPVGAWLLYQGATGQYVALFFMTLVGCTDFVDGWLARKYGPTVLGGLMDPIADKIFIVAVFLPYIDLGWLPAWLVGLLFLREFLVTGLRSAYERRGLKLKSTLLAQIKTWVQMGGAAVLFLLNISERQTMIWILLGGVFLPILAIGVRYLVRRYVWKVALVFTAWFLGTLVPYMLWGAKVASELLMLSMLAVTWISGWTYIRRATHLFTDGDSSQTPRAAPFDRADAVRILFAVLLPLCVVGAHAQTSVPRSITEHGTLLSVALIITLGLEMAVGGLDNLLCHHGKQTGALGWGARVGSVTLLCGLVFLATQPGSAVAAAGLTGPRLAVLACIVSLIGTVGEFWRGRDYYLDARLQSKPL